MATIDSISDAHPVYLVNAANGAASSAPTTDGSGNTVVVGNVANNVADTGSPVKIGGIASSAIPTTVGAFTRVNAWFNQNGALNSVQRGADTVATAQVTVGTSATVIAAARAGRSSITITNMGTTDVLIGLAGVTTANGLLLVGTKGASVTLACNGALSGIVGTGTQAVSVLEIY
jgi:hypothetical protein